MRAVHEIEWSPPCQKETVRMSVFDLPRLHFDGTAMTNLPTGPRNGLVDLTTHSVLTDGDAVSRERPADEYHDHLDRLDGKGTNFAGNGHFSIDARSRRRGTRGGGRDR